MAKMQNKERSISIKDFISAIEKLPEDKWVENPETWYRTQKEHWLGWLTYYNTEGAYGRKPNNNYDAKYAYNHAVNPGLLLYLIEAIPLSGELIKAAKKAETEHGPTMMAKAGAIRKVVPWSLIYQALFEK